MAGNIFNSVLPKGRNAYTIFDMQEKEIDKVEKRLRPGAYSAEGFLSKTGSIRKICVQDLETLKKLGISCDQICYTLKTVIKKAQDILKQTRSQLTSDYDPMESVEKADEQIIFGYLKVTGAALATNGFQQCPFHKNEENCHIGRQDFTIQNVRTKESIKISSLVFDLIGSHAFFEEGPYRVDPEKLCRVLELNPKKYETVIEKTWEWCSADEITQEEEEAAKKYAHKVEQLGPHVTAYLLPYEEDYEEYTKLTDEQRKKRNTKYCHVFVQKSLEKPESYIFDGIEIPYAFTFKNHYIFKLTEHTYVEMNECKSAPRKKAP